MMKASVLASLFAGATAFVPASRNMRSGVEISVSMDDMAGSINFAGKEMKFDPLKLSETYQPFLPWFRECELRHARTAMLAVVGFIVQDFVRIPGETYSFENVPTSADAHDKLLEMGWASPMAQLLLWIGLWDIVVTGPAAYATSKGEREPGDFGLTLFKPKDAVGYSIMVDKELLNGRLAMIAVGGIATQSVVSGHGFPYI